MPQARKKRSKSDDDDGNGRKSQATNDDDVQDQTDDDAPEDDEQDEQEVEEQAEEQTGRDVDLKIQADTITVTVPKDGNAGDTLHKVADFIDLCRNAETPGVSRAFRKDIVAAEGPSG